MHLNMNEKRGFFPGCSDEEIKVSISIEDIQKEI